MEKIILRGRRVSPGIAEGEALVTKDHIAFQGGVNPETGIVRERGHELEGKCITDMILVTPGGKGSSEGALRLYEMRDRGTAPKGIVNIEADTIMAVGAILADIPLVDKLEKNPLTLIKTGYLVRVNGDDGTVKIMFTK